MAVGKNHLPAVTKVRGSMEAVASRFIVGSDS